MHIKCYDCSTWIQTEDKLYICCVLLLTNWKEQIVNSEVYFTNLNFGDHEYLLWKHINAIKETMTHWQHYHFGSQISAHCHIVTVHAEHACVVNSKWDGRVIFVAKLWLLMVDCIWSFSPLQQFIYTPTQNDNCWESTATCTYPEVHNMDSWLIL